MGVSARVSRAQGLRQTGRERRALLEVSDAWPPLPPTPPHVPELRVCVYEALNAV